MAFYGWMLSQCQSIETPLQVQLQNGIRVLDVRLAVVEGRLVAYHGIYPEKTPFQIILSTVFTFLTAPPSSRETIVMSVKQEDYATTPLPIFSRLVREEFITGLGGLDMLFLENRIPKLGEVRGKIVLLSRFGGNGAEWEHGLEGLGIHPMIWPDSEKDGFSWECKDVHVRVHDWCVDIAVAYAEFLSIFNNPLLMRRYAIPSFLYIPEKVSIATKFLLPPASENKNRTLSIVYTSAASFPFAAPKTVALGFGWPKIGLGVEGINSRVGKWLLDAFSQPGANVNEKTCRYRMNEPRLRGWLLADFYDLPEHSLVDLLVECNFRGCNSEEEG
ncbi:hypothetical protein D9757_007180 [Collybiopsis confluens]|uniref:PLC-like phosphodiesterase n=1 Tax=Collybiopsis confluens TaxID=2823264 RepID=A0A8H5M3Z8_9AGAR|nr:hypothetical protein D9757_007180 [Collybiopsis confluens]